MSELQQLIATCQLCRLCEGRTKPVSGEGPANARIFLLGEAPGAEEDKSGKPFVGRAGRVLDNSLMAAGLTRKDIFITNTVKCRPPGNRKPNKDEIESCRRYLDAQLEAVRPAVMVTLGVVPLNLFRKTKKLETETFEWKGIRIVPTYHPAAALHGIPGARAKITESFKEAKKLSEEHIQRGGVQDA